MAKTIKRIIGSLFLLLLILAVVFATPYEYLYSPYTGRQDRTRSTNQSGTSWIFENVSGISLDEIENPAASKTFSIGGNTIAWRFTNPIGGVDYVWTGAASGHLFNLNQSGTSLPPGTMSHLLHIQAEDTDAISLHTMHMDDSGTALLVDNGKVNFSNADNVYVKNITFGDEGQVIRQCDGSNLCIDGGAALKVTTDENFEVSGNFEVIGSSTFDFGLNYGNGEGTGWNLTNAWGDINLKPKNNVGINNKNITAVDCMIFSSGGKICSGT